MNCEALAAWCTLRGYCLCRRWMGLDNDDWGDLRIIRLQDRESIWQCAGTGEWHPGVPVRASDMVRDEPWSVLTDSDWEQQTLREFCGIDDEP